MRDVLAKMGRHGLLIAVGLMLTRLVGFVVQPFLSIYLPPADFGIADNLAHGAQVILLVAMQGVQSGLFRIYAYSAKSQEERESAISTAFRYTLVSSVAVALGCALFAPKLSKVFAGDGQYWMLFVIVLLTYALANLKTLSYQVLRADYRSKEFLWVCSTEFILCAGLNLWFVIGLRLGPAGIIYSNLVGAAVALLLAIKFVPQTLEDCFERAQAREMATFGWPLVPAAVSLLLINSIGRFVLVHEFGEEDGLAQSGLYGRALVVATILEGVLLMPFMTFWPNVYYEIGRRPTAERDLGRCATYYVAVATFLALGLSVVAEPFVSLYLDERYYDSHRVVPILAFALLLYGLSDVTKVGMMIAGRTQAMTWQMVIALGVSFGLNFALVGELGFVGAAWATLGAYLALTILAGLRSRIFVRVRYEWSRLLRIALIAGVVLWLGSRLGLEPNLGKLDRIWELAWRGAAVCVIYPLLLIASGFLSARERELAVKALRDPRGAMLRLLGRA